MLWFFEKDTRLQCSEVLGCQRSGFGDHGICKTAAVVDIFFRFGKCESVIGFFQTMSGSQYAPPKIFEAPAQRTTYTPPPTPTPPSRPLLL